MVNNQPENSGQQKQQIVNTQVHFESGENIPIPFESIKSELPPLEQLHSFIQAARASFARELAYGLLESAILSYESRNWDELGQAIVDWASTLELEADRPLTRQPVS